MKTYGNLADLWHDINDIIQVRDDIDNELISSILAGLTESKNMQKLLMEGNATFRGIILPEPDYMDKYIFQMHCNLPTPNANQYLTISVSREREELEAEAWWEEKIDP